MTKIEFQRQIDQAEDLLFDAVAELPLMEYDLPALKKANDLILSASNKLTALIITQEEGS